MKTRTIIIDDELYKAIFSVNMHRSFQITLTSEVDSKLEVAALELDTGTERLLLIPESIKDQYEKVAKLSA